MPRMCRLGVLERSREDRSQVLQIHRTFSCSFVSMPTLAHLGIGETTGRVSPLLRTRGDVHSAAQVNVQTSASSPRRSRIGLVRRVSASPVGVVRTGRAVVLRGTKEGFADSDSLGLVAGLATVAGTRLHQPTPQV